MATTSHATPCASHPSNYDPRDLVVARICIELPATLRKLSSFVVKRISPSPAGLDMELSGAHDTHSEAEILKVSAQGWYGATGCPYPVLSDLVFARTVKIVTGPCTPAWEILPVVNAYQGKNRAILGLVISESAHYECNGVILHKLSCLLNSLSGATSHAAPSSTFFTGTQFQAASLYHAIKPNGNEQALTGKVAGLRCELRPFQRRSVYWMLEQEAWPGLASQSGLEQPKYQRHPLFLPLRTVDMQTDSAVTLYLNQVEGSVQLDDPQMVPRIFGGCLCEEMGLGKTVEVLACVLQHRCPNPAVPESLEDRVKKLSKAPRISCVCGAESKDVNDPEYRESGIRWVQCRGCRAWGHAECMTSIFCVDCLYSLAASKVPGQSRTTLIVCPDSILRQWLDEVERHVSEGHLAVFHYKGHSAKIHAKSLDGLGLSSHDLAEYDLVLTTYEVLRHDLKFEMSQGNSRSRRHAVKYPALPTPLTKLTFWRVVLDEAQMVEGTTQAAEMANCLSMVNRWCVTGTPISTGLDDVYGLLKFLKVEPWVEHRMWMKYVSTPVARGCPDATARLLSILQPAAGGILWRTSKNSVAHELGIPEQEHVEQHLTLTDVEWHAYRRTHKEVAEYARGVLPQEILDAVMQTGAVPTHMNRELTSSESHQLFPRLLRLRQTCCHPQLGQKNAMEGPVKKAAKTMDAVLQNLIDKDRVEAEDCQRILIAAYNGLAGLDLLSGNVASAVSWYSAILKLEKENVGLCDVDKMQLLHVYTNLGRLASGHQAVLSAENIPEDIQVQAERLRTKYLEEALGRMVMATHEYEKSTKKVKATDKEFRKAKPKKLISRGDESAARKPVPTFRHKTPPVPAEADMKERALKAEAEAKNQEKAEKERCDQPGGNRADDSTVIKRTEEEAGAQRSYAQVAGTSTATPEAQMNGREKSPAAKESATPVRATPTKKAKKRKRADEWDSDESSEEDEEESEEEEPEEEPRELTLEERYVHSFTDAISAATNTTYTAGTAAQNALSLIGKFDSIHDLCELLQEHFKQLEELQDRVLQELERLIPLSRNPPQELHEQAGACSVCHKQNGVKGLVCTHCKLEKDIIRWECRLFRLSAKALKSGNHVTHTNACEQYYQEQILGRGSGQGPAAADIRKKSVVSSVQLVHQDSEQHILLQHLVQLLRRTGDEGLTIQGIPEPERERMVECAKHHLKWIRDSQALLLKARQLVVSQKHHLYKYDELEMCVARLSLYEDGKYTPMRDQLFLSKAEIPARHQELQNDKAVALKEYKDAFGKLRYAINLRQQKVDGGNSNVKKPQQQTGAGPSTSSTPAQGPTDGHATPAAGPSGNANQDGRRAETNSDKENSAGHIPQNDAGHMQVPQHALDVHRKIARASAQLLAQPLQEGPPGAEECPVCNEFMLDKCMMAQCGHRWCAACHMKMRKIQSKLRCPLCNTEGTKVTTVSLKAPNLDDDEDSAMENAVKQLKDSYGTKIDGVVRCIKGTLRQKPDDKILVFSTWTDVLDLLAHALNYNNIQFCYGNSGTKLKGSLDCFKSESDKQVLLLLLKRAGAGLNIVEAQHAFLMEPSTDPAIEAQAVARIHRMNQKKKTRVVRFIVDGTVEAALHTLTSSRAAGMDMVGSSTKGNTAKSNEPTLTLSDVACMLFDAQLGRAFA